MPKKTEVVKNYKEVNVKGVKVIGISSPKTIKSIANERGINPLEVYVRLIYKKGKVEYTASQKLDILGKEDYDMLRSLAGKDEVVDLNLTTYEDKNGEIQAFFSLEDKTSSDELFETPLAKEPAKKRTAAPANILAALLGNN